MALFRFCQIPTGFDLTRVAGRQSRAIGPPSSLSAPRARNMPEARDANSASPRTTGDAWHENSAGSRGVVLALRYGGITAPDCRLPGERTMKRQIPIVDVFSGPGGLAEGFAPLREGAGRHRFRVALSVEMDATAHRTLRLRAFLRKFARGL